MQRDEARALLAHFLAVPIRLQAPETLYDRALVLVDEYHLPAVSDAHSVALAERLGATLLDGRPAAAPRPGRPTALRPLDRRLRDLSSMERSPAMVRTTDPCGPLHAVARSVERNDKPPRVAVYCRVSSDEQAQAGTIANQLDFARRYCDLHGRSSTPPPPMRA